MLAEIVERRPQDRRRRERPVTVERVRFRHAGDDCGLVRIVGVVTIAIVIAAMIWEPLLAPNTPMPRPIADPVFVFVWRITPYEWPFDTSTFGLATTGSITNPRFSSALRSLSEASAEERLCPSIELALSGAGKR